MIDHVAAQLALRNRALSVVVATTGPISLSATAEGFARTTGSFITDGFAVGMELGVTAFNTEPRIIRGVSALALKTDPAPTVSAAAANRTLTVGAPTLLAKENVAFSPVAGRPYLDEDYVPATSNLVTTPASAGLVEETGLYVLKWYGLAGTGPSALRRSVTALLKLFAPGTQIVAGQHTLRVRTDVGPFAGQIQPADDGLAVIALTIPWVARSRNAIAA